MFDDTYRGIISALRSGYSDRDCCLLLDNVPSGIWVWHEKQKLHIRFTREELIESIGPSIQLEQWIRSLPVFRTSWKFLPSKQSGKLSVKR